MPDQTVRVSFTRPDTWEFDPPATHMKAAGKIKLVKHPASAPWRFVTAEVLGAAGDFTVHANPNGNQVTIEDRCRTAGTFAYVVRVEQDGERFAGQARSLAAVRPPTIENQPQFSTDAPE